MYIDLIIFIVLTIIVFLKYNKFHSYILFFAIVDITLRILTFVRTNIPIKKVSNFIGDYLPNSLLDLINKYTSNLDMVNLILRWIYVGIMTIFLYYIIKLFLKKRKI